MIFDFIHNQIRKIFKVLLNGINRENQVKTIIIVFNALTFLSLLMTSWKWIEFSTTSLPPSYLNVAKKTSYKL